MAGDISLIHPKINQQRPVWETSTILPQWMKDYFLWHQEQRRILDQYPQRWESYQFLIMRCLMIDECGGASDRLHQIPLVIRVAAETKRLFFIKWENRPAPLEEFLIPPPGGLDWRVPSWLEDKLQFDRVSYINNNNYYAGMLANYSMIQGTFVDTMANFGGHHGQLYYDRRCQPGEPNFETVYGDVWRSVFQPVPTIQSRIDQELAVLGLAVGNYTSVHVRSKYLSEASFDNVTNENAIHCGLELQPDMPVYVASDSPHSIQYMVEYGKRIQKRIVARVIHQPPLHLDRGGSYFRKPFQSQFSNVSAAMFYDTFIDLYILAGAKCVSYGKGGYGRWASRLSLDPMCSKYHPSSQCAGNFSLTPTTEATANNAVDTKTSFL